MSRIFALFNSGDKGASLSVENGGILLTTTASGLSIARSCRSTISQTTNDSDAEFILFTTADTPPSIANKVSIGLCTAAASMSAYIGAEGESIGYRPAEGQIHTGGSSVASVVTAGLGDAIRVAINFNEVGADVSFYVNGGEPIATVALPAGMVGEAIFLGVSLGSDAAPGDIRVQMTAGNGRHGSRQMEYPGEGFSGWWTAYALAEAVRISTIPYVSHHDDDVPGTRWEEGITARSVGDVRGFNVWWWGGDNQVQGSILQLEYTDPAGLLDHLLNNAYRDQPVTVQFLDRNDPLSAAVDAQTYYFDRCEVRDDLTKIVYLRDIISLLDLPLQGRAYRPDVDPQAANRWMPTLIGVAGSIPTTVVDGDEGTGAEPILQISGQDVEAIGKVREAGVPLAAGTDYTLLASGQQLQLAVPPDTGEITLDASRTGASYIPPAPVDALGGIGNPFADDGGGDIVGWDRFKDDGGAGDSTPFWEFPGRVVFPQTSSARAHITPIAFQITAGQWYRGQFTVDQLHVRGARDAEIGLAYGIDRFWAIRTVRSTEFYAGNPDGDPRTYTFTFQAEATVFPSVFYYGMEDNSLISGKLSGLTLIELPPQDDTGNDIAVEDALPRLNLEDGMRMIIETHAGMLPTAWDSAEAAIVDAATNDSGGGNYFEDQTTRREALERFMPGKTSGIYKKRNGQLGVKRMVLPEEEIGSDPIIITAADLLSDLIVRRDAGPGLSRQLGLRKNHRILTDGDVNTAGLSLSSRARLSRLYRYVMATGASFAPGYDHVDSADPLDTTLWMPNDGQAEIDFAGRAYSHGRAWGQSRMGFRDDIDIGTIVLLQYPRYGMSDGIPAFCIPRVEDRVNGVFEEIEFWMPAPGTGRMVGGAWTWF